MSSVVQRKNIPKAAPPAATAQPAASEKPDKSA